MKEAFSAKWVIYALSDFNGQIQARDIIRFLHFASEDSKGDSHWYDRILVPPAIRGSLSPCSQKKIMEISEENLDLKRIFEKINEVSIDKKRVPFDQYDLDIEPIDLEILERNGVIGRDGEKYYIPEIFREGLGFILGKGARPKVVTMAITSPAAENEIPEMLSAKGKPDMSEKKSESLPIKMQPVYDEIVALTDAVCGEHLDEEYAELARKMAAALARKRPSPLERGRKDVWAAAIVYSLGNVNFLFDKISGAPYEGRRAVRPFWS